MAKRKAFFDAVRASLFGGALTQQQVEALNTIIDAWAKYGDKFSYGKLRLAYVLATAHHETARFRYMREVWGPTPAQKRYEGRADLGNTQSGDGHRFLGRGFVQITGRRNYTDWARRLGIDIVAQPELAERRDIAARILVEGMVLGTFTGRKLQDYINSDEMDFVNARRVVNGTDRAADIALYARKYLAALEADAAVAEPPGKPSASTVPLVLFILALVIAGAFFILGS